MSNERLNLAAKFIYNEYKKGTYKISLKSDQLKVIEQLQSEKFMNNEFWLRLDGLNCYIEKIN